MSATFTDDDVGKRVETATGETLGVVATTEAETAYLEANDGAVDSIRAVLGWEADTDEIVPLDGGAVGEITDEAIRLDAESSGEAEEGTDPVIEREEDTEDEDVAAQRRRAGPDPGETDEDALASEEGRSGEAVQPETEEMQEAGAERHPESEDQPPQGERTVTKDRGEEEDR